MFKAIESEYEIVYLDNADWHFVMSYTHSLSDFVSRLIEYGADYMVIDTCLRIWVHSDSPVCGPGFQLSEMILEKDPSQKIIGVTCHVDPIEMEEAYKGHGMVDVIHYYNYRDRSYREDEVRRIISRLKEIEERI